MLPYGVLAVVFLAFFYLVVRGIRKKSAAHVADAFWALICGLGLFFAVYLFDRGRVMLGSGVGVGMLILTAGGLAIRKYVILNPYDLPARMEAASVRQDARQATTSSTGWFDSWTMTFDGKPSGQERRQVSQVETAYLRMTLDHETGAMTGEVLAGPFSGQTVESMAPREIAALLEECEEHDREAATILEAWADRTLGMDWREAAAAEDAVPEPAMSESEAYNVLGLEPGATPEAVRAAYHRLMQKLHPDLGGSTYLAAKVNEARERLLGT